MKKSKQFLSMFLVLTILLSLVQGINFSSFAKETENTVSTTSAQSKPQLTGEFSYSATNLRRAKTQALTNETVLLIQTNDPWETTSNVDLLTTLVQQGKLSSYDVVSMENAVNKDFSAYSVVLIANDQTYDSYKQYSKIKAGIEKYIYSGGYVFFGACDSGWAGGIISNELPGGVTKYNYYSYNDYIADKTHPAILGTLTGKSSMTDSMLQGNKCSHTCFEQQNLPQNTDVILRSTDTNDPTLIQYTYGNGTVIASGLTWEFYYNGQHSDSNYGYANYYKDFILYMLSLSQASVQEQPKQTVDSDFKIGRDSNNYCHYNDNSQVYNAGFVGVKNYKMSDPYYNKLVNNSSSAEKSAVKSYINHGGLSFIERIKKHNDCWGGSCYGIATTMGMKYENYLSLSNLSSQKSTSYYTLPFPYLNKQFLDVIQYFQVSQMLSKGGRASAAISYTVNDENLKNQEYSYDNLRTFLQKLVKAASNGDVTLLGYSYDGGGHAVLITGCTSDPTINSYRVKVFDENTVGSSSSGYFYEMIIPFDYRSLSMTTNHRLNNGNFLVLNNDSYSSMYILDWAKMKQLDGSAKGREASVNDDTTNLVTLALSADDAMTLKNDNGESLSYDNGKLQGDMPIYSVSTLDGAALGDEDTAPCYLFKVEKSDSFHITNADNNVAVEVYDDNQFISLATKDIDSAVISLENGIEISGDNYSFNSFISTDEKVGKDENNLVCVSADANGDTTITKAEKKVEISCEDVLKDVDLSNYVGNKEGNVHYDTLVEQSVGNILGYHSHDYDNGVVTKKPTYTAAGTKVFTCSICGDKKSVAIPKLEKTSLTKTSISGIKNKTYNGKAQKQAPVIKYKKSTLKLGKDYKLSYKNNKNIGTATVIITGTGAFKGTVKKTFNILPKGTAMTKLTSAKKSFSAKWKKQNSVSGYQIQYATNAKFTSAKIKTVKKSGSLKCTVNNLKKNKNYYIRIRTYKTVSKKHYMSTWSKTYKVKTK